MQLLRTLTGYAVMDFHKEKRIAPDKHIFHGEVQRSTEKVDVRPRGCHPQFPMYAVVLVAQEIHKTVAILHIDRRQHYILTSVCSHSAIHSHDVACRGFVTPAQYQRMIIFEIRGKERFSVYLNISNIFDRAYVSHLSRLKDVTQESPSGHTPVYNMDRNIGVRIVVPFSNMQAA